MKSIVYFLERFQRRSWLIALAVLLVVVYGGSLAHDAYMAKQGEVESMQAKLRQYQLVTRKADVFENRLSDLLKIKEQVGRYFFAGEDDDKLASAMQLRVQALVAKSGLQAESIRAMMQKADGGQDKDGEGNILGEVLIKVTLAGTLEEFMDFMAALYRGQEFFEIESVSLKPYRDTGLKIFIELKGYYILPGQKNGVAKDT